MRVTSCKRVPLQCAPSTLATCHAPRAPPPSHHHQVATWEYYVDDLGRRGVLARGLPRNTRADEVAMFDMLVVRCRAARCAGGCGERATAACSVLSACAAAAAAVGHRRGPCPCPTTAPPPPHTQNGTLDAVVMKRPTVEFFTYPSCSLTEVPTLEFDIVRG